ncbi:hypothetical protein T440DRAFT_89967 [Plenodomus tracheiphilus IPT5]|uniref:Uncharacterized protein n=1 Tax=Plenodomus tracheiphilus IPT5 TaxID=1408161 RepID=A0A6A7B4N3_9PLEO|nr:hypothetical protein T440DRAFT_89967 [Plenodomus tracheiphilus IPT5]
MPRLLLSTAGLFFSLNFLYPFFISFSYHSVHYKRKDLHRLHLKEEAFGRRLFNLTTVMSVKSSHTFWITKNHDAGIPHREEAWAKNAKVRPFKEKIPGGCLQRSLCQFHNVGIM